MRIFLVKNAFIYYKTKIIIQYNIGRQGSKNQGTQNRSVVTMYMNLNRKCNHKQDLI
jgi:hypothetical protein